MSCELLWCYHIYVHKESYTDVRSGFLTIWDMNTAGDTLGGKNLFKKSLGNAWGFQSETVARKLEKLEFFLLWLHSAVIHTKSLF